MKLTVLMDNNTYIDQYYLGEPAACYYIEEGDARILLDCGYSDAFIKNAEKMGIDLSELTHIVFSHGHDDHTRGLKFLKETVDLSGVEIIAHPDAFYPKRDGELFCGSPFSKEEIASFCKLHVSGEPVQLTDNLWFLGEIRQVIPYEEPYVIGQRQAGDHWEDDYCNDDTALVYKGKDGLFFITGCSHSGICNIMEQGRRLLGEDRFSGVIGGLHLFEVDQRLAGTIEYMKENKVKNFYPCHCVSLKAKAKMMESLDIEEVGVGLTIEIQ